MKSSTLIPGEMREFDNGVEKDAVLIFHIYTKLPINFSLDLIQQFDQRLQFHLPRYKQKVKEKKKRHSSGAKSEYALLAWTRYQALILSPPPPKRKKKDTRH